MKDGLEEFLKRIEAKPTNETLIDRFMTLVLEVDGVDRILYLKKLVGLLLNPNPYVALKAAYVELQEARKEKLTTEYEIGALKDVESCFIKLGRQENANLVRDEINKLQGKLGADAPMFSPPPKKSIPPMEIPSSLEFGGDEVSEQQPIASTRRSVTPQDPKKGPLPGMPLDEKSLDIFDTTAGSDPLLDEPRGARGKLLEETRAPSGKPLERTTARPLPLRIDGDMFGQAQDDDDEPQEPLPANSISRASQPERAVMRPTPPQQQSTAVKTMPIDQDTDPGHEPLATKARGYGGNLVDNLFLQMPEDIGKKPTIAPMPPAFPMDPEPEADDALTEEMPDIFSMNFEYTKRSKLPGLVDDGSAPRAASDIHSSVRLSSAPALGNFSAAELFNDSDDEDEKSDDEDTNPGDGLPVVARPHFANSIRSEDDEPTNPNSRPRKPGDAEGTAIISVESLQESKKQMESVAKAVAPDYQFRTANDNDQPEEGISPYHSNDDEDESKLYFAPDDDNETVETPPGAPSSSMFRGSPPDALSEVTSFLDLGAIQPLLQESAAPLPALPQMPVPTVAPQPVYVPAPAVELRKVKVLEPIASDDDWLQFQERLRMLSGIAIDKNHAVEFVRRLLGVSKESAEVAESLRLLTLFMEKRSSPQLKKRVSAWLFEQLPAGAMHDLLESMTLGDQGLKIYSDYLQGLFTCAQYRQLIRVVRDVVRENLKEGWYKRSFQFLPETWEKLGMEGFAWSEEEGGKIFCERILKRENPGLALLLA